MSMLAVWSWVPPFLNIILLLVGLFLILLVLIQRGKGGGLAGAFGGAGGSSAFGSRAGDAFTRVTIFVAAFWLLLIMIMIKMIQPLPPRVDIAAESSIPTSTSTDQPADKPPEEPTPEQP
jgi:preprotein translocase subunit SecG